MITTLYLCFRDAYEFLHKEIFGRRGVPDVWIGMHYLDSSIGKVEGKVSNGCI